MSESIQLKLSKRNTFQRQFFVDLIKSEVEGILDSINSKNDYKYSKKAYDHLNETLLWTNKNTSRICYMIMGNKIYIGKTI